MKPFLIKLVNRYTLTYLILFLVCVSAVLLAQLLDGQNAPPDSLFGNALVLILLPGIFLAMPLDIYMSGFSNTVWYQLIGIVLATFFSALTWSLPIWGMLFVAQINPWKRSNKK